ncbi:MULTISPECIES: ComEC/Rec2 family competence protein [Polaromonas]|uniref:ComEC/Rec2 family competence protein n=1 Tax=Polaromonas aquatica TaxID=332657 RepID=A0ABW1TY66_9BURK
MADGLEIEFLPVGTGEHCGDAITVRWREGDRFRVLVYDGGTSEYGPKLVTHLKTNYNTGHVDYLVNSHPDNDHAAGLEYVVNNMSVGEVWMHRPWAHSEKIRHYFHDGRITDDSLKKRFQQKMSAAYALEKAAIRKDRRIYEPFAGAQIGIFTVLSPKQNRYVHELVPKFEKTPELGLGKLLDQVMETGQLALEKLKGVWDAEFLPESVTTSAENESSAILLARYSGRGYLLTGDAGVESLVAAADYAADRGIDLPSTVTFVQIPHHGGRHNVSTNALDRLVGKRLPRSHEPKRIAFASASEKAPKHPKKVVTNAFARRGFKVGRTKGKWIRHSFNMPARNGEGPMELVPFFEDDVE